jgi:hypothetical protein
VIDNVSETVIENRPRTVIDNVQKTVIDQVPVTTNRRVPRTVTSVTPVTTYEKQTVLVKNNGHRGHRYGRRHGYGYGSYSKHY